MGNIKIFQNLCKSIKSAHMKWSYEMIECTKRKSNISNIITESVLTFKNFYALHT